MRSYHRSPVRASPLAPALTAVMLALGSAGCAVAPGGDPGAVFYPAAPQRPRIQFLASFVGAEDVEGSEGWLVQFLVGDVASQRQMRKPAAVTAHDGVIYVADPGWDTVLILDLKEGVFDTLRDRGAGKLRVPVAIAIDDEGNKFVADTGRRQVVQFNAQNEYVGAFGRPSGFLPTGVAVDDEFLYVVNRNAHAVEVFSRRSGKKVRSIGEAGEDEGMFNRPTSLSIDSSGHVFVTDATNFRIQEFDADGSYVKSYGFLGDGPGTFGRPKGIAVDRSGHLYTVDAAFENVQVWDTSNAQVLLAFGGPGRGPGDMYLPQSVHVDYALAEYFRDRVDPAFELEYVILVANNYGPNKVAAYGFVNPRDPDLYPDTPAPQHEPEE